MPRTPAEYARAVLVAVQKADDAGDYSRLEGQLQDLIDDGVCLAKEHGQTKDGLPASAFAYVGDAADPSTWKLPYRTASGSVDRAHLSGAMAALSSGGFRGNRVSLPSGAVAGVKAKLRAAHAANGGGEDDLPEHMKDVSKGDDDWWEFAEAGDDWWNSRRADDAREVMALKIHVEIDKAATEPTQRKVWGWASVTEKNGVPVVDGQNDVIDSSEMQRAVHEWIMSDGPTNGIPGRTMGDSHRRIGIGKICDSIFFTDAIKKALNVEDRITNTGWYIGAHVDDPKTWADVESGRLRAFSIGAKAFREPMD